MTGGPDTTSDGGSRGRKRPRFGARARRRVGFVFFLGLAFIAMTVASLLLPRAKPTPRARGFEAPALAPNLGWLNTDRPLLFDGDLRGRVVLLDFWTHGCVNCQHVIPDLKYLEAKYADEPFVVIGVHSAKFSGEADRASVRNAVLRAGITHPVVIDDGKRIWDAYKVNAWPTFVLIGSDGRVVGGIAGEGNRRVLDLFIQRALSEGRARGDLAAGPPDIDHQAMTAPASGLWFPGKVHAVAPLEGEPGYLFIADSSHHRVLVTEWPDETGRTRLIAVIGSGERALADGPPESASFNEPRGMVFDRATRTLYVADTKNHAIRAVDAGDWSVRTIVGNGYSSRDRVGGRAGREQSLGSPWSLALEPGGGSLLVAMAGPHQLWRVDLADGSARAVVGSGRENSVDGPLEDAALAQPSGIALSADGARAYFADTESSSIRVADFEEDAVRTIVGARVDSMLDSALFTFGDVDGTFPDARLQHPLGVTILEHPRGPNARGGDRLLVADSYNDTLKIVDPGERSSVAWRAPAGLVLDQPSGLHAAGGRVFVADTNHHRVVMIDEATGAWREVAIEGLGGPGEPEAIAAEAIEATLALATDAPVELRLEVALPRGAKVNAEFPASVRVTRLVGGENAPMAHAAVLSQRTGPIASLPMEIELPSVGWSVGDRLLVECSLAYCFDDQSVCIPAEVAWIVRTEAGDSATGVLNARVE